VRPLLRPLWNETERRAQLQALQETNPDDDLSSEAEILAKLQERPTGPQLKKREPDGLGGARSGFGDGPTRTESL
jgi:hypothetical protein